MREELAIHVLIGRTIIVVRGDCVHPRHRTQFKATERNVDRLADVALRALYRDRDVWVQPGKLGWTVRRYEVGWAPYYRLKRKEEREERNRA